MCVNGNAYGDIQGILDISLLRRLCPLVLGVRSLMVSTWAVLFVDQYLRRPEYEKIHQCIEIR